MRIVLDHFLGEMPAVLPEDLSPHHSTEAWNIPWESGAAVWSQQAMVELDEAAIGSVQQLDPASPARYGTIYRFRGEAGDPLSGALFTWRGRVNCSRGPVRNDEGERTYWTGDGHPKYTDKDFEPPLVRLAHGARPANWKTLGVPAPPAGTRPMVAPEADWTDASPDPSATAADAVSRRYVFCWVSDRGEQGPPSEPSVPVDALPGTVPRVNIPVGPPAQNQDPARPGARWNVATKRIYRTLAAGEGFWFCKELPLATPHWDDNLADAELGERLPSLSHYPPPADMHSFGVLDNGICYGASGHQVCLSEPYLPHAWNPLNFVPTSEEIIALGKWENTVVALTAQDPLLVMGASPAAMVAQELRIGQACVSARSVVSGPWGVLYASPDGMVLVGPGSPGVVVTDGIWTRQQWQAMKPETIVAEMWNGHCIFSHEGIEGEPGSPTGQAAWVFHPAARQAGAFRIPGTRALSLYRDPLEDRLWMHTAIADDGSQTARTLLADGFKAAVDAASPGLSTNGYRAIPAIANADPPETAWKSKRFPFPRPACFTAARAWGGPAAMPASITVRLQPGRDQNGAAVALDGSIARLGRMPADGVVVEVRTSDGSSGSLARLDLAESAQELVMSGGSR